MKTENITQTAEAYQQALGETGVIVNQEDTNAIHLLAPFMDVSSYTPYHEGPKRKKGPHETTFWDSSSKGTYVNPKREKKNKKK